MSKHGNLCLPALFLGFAIALWGCKSSQRAADERAEVEALQKELVRIQQRVEQLQRRQPEGEIPCRSAEAAISPELSEAQAARIRKLVEELGTRNIVEQYQTALKLKEIGKPAIPYLIEGVQSQKKGVRRSAAVLLAELGATDAVPYLIEGFKKTDDSTEKGIFAGALAKLGDKRAVPALIEGLKSDNWRVQTLSARAIAKLEDSRAVPALVEMLSSSNEQVRASAAYALKKVGKKGIPEISKLFPSAPGDVKVQILNILAEIGGDQSVAELRKALEDANMYVRLAAARGLAKLGKADGLGVANEALRSGDAKNRDFGMQIIRQLGEKVEFDPAASLWRLKELSPSPSD